MAGGGSMQDIKRRVKSVTSIEHITNAMKLVSSAKLRKAKDIFENTQEFFHYVTESIEEIFNSTNDVPRKYLSGEREIINSCYIIVTSNKGLAGSFNANIIRRAEEEILADPEPPHIIAIGSKGRDYFQKKGYTIATEYLLPPENISFVETKNISKPIIELYDKGAIDEVILIYTSFISPLEQRVKTVTLLPFEIEHTPDAIRNDKQVEYDPSPAEVFNYLVPKYVEIMIYGAVVESATCEHAARRIAMENATDNAQSMIADLSLTYNRARQAAITNEITEIISGSETMS